MRYDAIILGAGGAGLFCAMQAALRGKRVVVLDHGKKAGGKILISGGGRCNFTNLGASPAQYVSENAHFCKSAMMRFRPQDFIALVEKHKIPYHEKKLGQLFCDRSASDIVQMLLNECREAGAEILLETKVLSVTKADEFTVETSRGAFTAAAVVVATGGLSIPAMGATGFGYEIARQFGLRVTDTAPALDGFTLPEGKLAELSGLSVDCVMSVGKMSFRENILFTHKGLSGPASLQCSLHWQPAQVVKVRLLPDLRLREFFLEKKRSGIRVTPKNFLAEHMPRRLAEFLVDEFLPVEKRESPWLELGDKVLEGFADALSAWEFRPSGTVGYSKAEVTRGGVDTDEISSKTMEAKKVPGLFFIGEVVDVTGWLGGYNFHWAWASAKACAEVL